MDFSEQQEELAHKRVWITNDGLLEQICKCEYLA
jgi:hypothetical protein